MQEPVKISGNSKNADLAADLIKSVEGSKPFEELVKALTDRSDAAVSGLPGSLCSVLLAAISRIYPLIVVAPDSRRSEELLDDLYLLMDEDEVCFLPPGGDSRLRRLSPESASHHRAEAMLKLVSKPPRLLMVLPGTLAESFPTLKSLRERTLRLKVGAEIEPQTLLRRLLNAGFRREVQVEGCGETALRGGILDMFPYGYRNPLRLEFWGDEIISLRSFDPRNQRSMKELKEAEVFLDRTRKESASVFELLKGLVFWDDEDEIVERYKRIVNDDINPLRLLPENYPRLIHRPLGRGKINFGGASADMFLGSAIAFWERTERYLQSGNQVLVGMESEYRRERFHEFVADCGDDFLDLLKVGVLPLQSGFVFPGGSTVFFTEHELFDRPRPRRSFARFRTYAHPIEPDALKAGDFVVHADYGIGIFQGLKEIKVANHERECLHIEYRDKVNLYVRLEAFDKVCKYSGREGFVPAVSKIGGRSWKQTQKRAKKALMDMARELITLHAKRKVKSGISFDSDDLWQKQMEDSFVYRDTTDQSRAAREVKDDMERNRPMDRLLLGDVGFGKTEVAVRAAFKAVRSDRQVALLAPTTILVQQHLHTFRERMAEYPVMVESLSRFRSPAEQRRVIQGLRNGSIDIVIGTHRILSKDVAFRRLGLLIVDEEHRFGVRHKEKLKRLREEVDVLTLTATPIPRTLHFALMGTRDLSRIETAPEDRMSIVTEVLPFDRGLIREAILNEKNRGGQTFFIHNRVRSIGAVKSMLSRIVPEASYAIAHGQMKSKDLERVMLDFMKKRFDCLVCTMIVESGIDLPNVNTMIINRADKMGLAQLYQLRGRIGRSDRQAYAYLLIPPKLGLTREARSRLETIAQFTELGAGFQVALKDLEIRGAGNLLGAEQSGYINSVGFDLYSRMLDEAVNELREEIGGEKTGKTTGIGVEDVEVKLDIAVDAHIPAEYLFEEDLRVNIYRRLAACGTLDDLRKLEEEIVDRFGPVPTQLMNLLRLLRLKLMARSMGIITISLKRDTLKVEFSGRDGGYRELIERAVKGSGGNQIEFITGPPFSIKMNLNSEDNWKMKLAEADKFLFCLGNA